MKNGIVFTGKTDRAASEKAAEKIIAEKIGKNTGFSRKTCYNRGSIAEGGASRWADLPVKEI